jgi:hypothetical protein
MTGGSIRWELCHRIGLLGLKGQTQFGFGPSDKPPGESERVAVSWRTGGETLVEPLVALL